MHQNQIKLRVATPEDAKDLLDIYAPYVKKTAITFEYEVPSVEQFHGRITNTLKKYPYIVAVLDDNIVGYAYTGTFVGRAACDWAVKTSIYIKEGCQKLGLGKRLYHAIESISKAQHLLNLNACIAYREVEDAYLTKNSVQFHEHLGFMKVGEFHQCGYKFGNWYNLVWMEKHLGSHDLAPLPVIWFSDLSKEIIEELLSSS